jgi:hypothetical protein
VVDLDEESTTPPWHERTNTVVGASIAAVLALLLMYFAVSCVSRSFNDPQQTPQYYLDPGGSTTPSTYTTSTTTSTSYSVVPPQTTDINPGDTTTPTSTSTVRGDSTTHRRTPSNDGDDTTTTRRPRFNQTRPVFQPFMPNFFGPNN